MVIGATITAATTSASVADIRMTMAITGHVFADTAASVDIAAASEAIGADSAIVTVTMTGSTAAISGVTAAILDAVIDSPIEHSTVRHSGDVACRMDDANATYTVR